MNGTEFQVVTHAVTREPMVEFWKDGKIIAGIYGHEDGMRIVSKYMDGVEHELGYPPGVVIKLSAV